MMAAVLQRNTGQSPGHTSRPLFLRSETIRFDNNNRYFHTGRGSKDKTLLSCCSKISESKRRVYKERIKYAVVCLFLFALSGIIMDLYYRVTTLESERGLCVPCSSLVVGDDVLDDYSVYFKPSGTSDAKCCATNPRQYQLIFDAYVQRGIRGPQMMALFEDRTFVYTHSAQVFLGNRPVTPSRGYETVIGWTISADVAFIRKGINWDEGMGTFTITQQGLYVVYSHIAYRRSPYKRRTQGFIYSQKIVRKNDLTNTALEDLIVDTEVRNCNDENLSGVPCYSSNIITQLRLRQGDVIGVQTLNQELIITNGKASYFGIFMLY